jgi:hypothetical protein
MRKELIIMKFGALLLVVLMFVMVAPSFAFTPTGDTCHYTPGYWKNHPEVWPLMSMTFHGHTYSQSELIDILKQPVRGDASIILAHHTIAGVLNGENGAALPENGCIMQGIELLDMYGIGCDPEEPVRGQMLAVKDLLCAYNEMIVPGCFK